MSLASVMVCSCYLVYILTFPRPLVLRASLLSHNSWDCSTFTHHSIDSRWPRLTIFCLAISKDFIVIPFKGENMIWNNPSESWKQMNEIVHISDSPKWNNRKLSNCRECTIMQWGKKGLLNWDESLIIIKFKWT